MALFKTRQPRKYNRISIYTNERKDRLDKLVNDVKREMGELPLEDATTYDYKGKFAKFTPRAQRAGKGGRRLTWPVALVVVLLLLLAWHYILAGKL